MQIYAIYLRADFLKINLCHRNLLCVEKAEDKKNYEMVTAMKKNCESILFHYCYVKTQ